MMPIAPGWTIRGRACAAASEGTLSERNADASVSGGGSWTDSSISLLIDGMGTGACTAGTTYGRTGMISMAQSTPSHAVCRSELERTLATARTSPMTSATSVARIED
jgi:hypothetical protein